MCFTSQSTVQYDARHYSDCDMCTYVYGVVPERHPVVKRRKGRAALRSGQTRKLLTIRWPLRDSTTLRPRHPTELEVWSTGAGEDTFVVVIAFRIALRWQGLRPDVDASGAVDRRESVNVVGADLPIAVEIAFVAAEHALRTSSKENPLSSNHDRA